MRTCPEMPQKTDEARSMRSDEPGGVHTVEAGARSFERAVEAAGIHVSRQSAKVPTDITRSPNSSRPYRDK